jgi:hypothetical protein
MAKADKATALQEARKLYLSGVKKGDVIRHTLFTGVTVTATVARVTQGKRQIVLEDGTRFDRNGLQTGVEASKAKRIVTG